MEYLSFVADAISQGWGAVAGFRQFGLILLGGLVGVVAGSTPGISSGMALAILLPITFPMSSTDALVFLATVYIAVTYGGSLTAIILNTPGAPENSATAFDGYPMTQRGEAGRALGVAITSSFAGGLLAYIFMLVGMPMAARFAAILGPPELFLITILGVMMLGAMGQGSPLKLLLSGFLGLLIGTIGIVPTGEWRATFDLIYLAEGVPIVPAMIGLFVFSELLDLIRRPYVTEAERVGGSLGSVFQGVRDAIGHFGVLLRSTGIGIVVGLIPGAGATLAAFTSYGIARQRSKNGESFGTGNPEGIVAAESANNACSGGSLITMLAFGIPGSVATAVLLGALTMHGVQVGPRLLTDPSLLGLTYGLIIAVILAQPVILLNAALVGAGLMRSLAVPTRVLIPILAALSMIGSFGVRNASFDIYLMVAFGVLGFVMKKTGYSVAAVTLGLVLAPIADNELVRTVQLYGDNWYEAFVRRPVSIVILGLFLLSAFATVRKALTERRTNLGTTQADTSRSTYGD